MQDSESNLVRKEPCPACGSRDNLARYSDGHAYCFSQGCGHYEHGDGEVHTGSPKKARMEGLLVGEYKPLLKRKITEETARKFGYQYGEYNGKVVQIAPYFDASGSMVAQKVRFADKSFTVAGDSKSISGLLFGSNLWNGGKKIVITEGEIDAMSVSQAQGNKWPVVSIPNGAAGAKKSLSKALEYLNGFEEIILMFDMDEPGKAAAAECAELFEPGKCKIAALPMKDPNELLQAGREQDIITAIWNAKEYRPDGLVNVIDLREEILAPMELGLPWFLDELTNLTYGRRYGEVYGFGAGTGVGKTDLFTQQIAYDRQVLGLKIGTIFLEQKPRDTAKRIAGKIKHQRFHVPNAGWTQAELESALDMIGDQIVLYDSFGETEWNVVKAKIRYMVKAQGIRIFYLDHLTAMADTADEKGSLEQIMKEMAGLANELDIIIHFVSHLATPEGKSHEEGGRVSIRHFKGSRAIGFWAHGLFGLERDQQADDPVVRMTTTLRVLKERYTGQATGEVIFLGYDKDTGLLSVTSAPTEASPFKDETGTKPEF